MILKSGLEITQGHSNWYSSKACVRFLFAFYSNYGSILHHFRDMARYWSNIVIFFTPPCIRGVPVGVLLSRLIWKKLEWWATWR